MNWFRRAGSGDLFSVVREDTLIGTWGQAEPVVLNPDVVPAVESLDTMIMPPTADKAQLYSDATMAAIERAARRAVIDADHLVIFGSSLPATDTSMRSFLQGSVRLGTTVTVADPRADLVCEALDSLGDSDDSDHAGVRRGIRRPAR